MTNRALDQNLLFDTELSIAASSTSTLPVGSPISNRAVIILFKNQSDKSVFVSMDGSTTKGTTMAAGENFVLDCRANGGQASNMGIPQGTQFYATFAATGTGNLKISILYAT